MRKENEAMRLRHLDGFNLDMSPKHGWKLAINHDSMITHK